MKKSFYLFKSGELKRKDSSLTYLTDDNKFDIPVETVDDIYLFGKTIFNTDLIYFLSDKDIILNIFDYYGNLKSSIVPTDSILSGVCKINQVNKFNKCRNLISTKILESAKHTIIENLKEYNIECENIKNINFYETDDINTIMGKEGNIRKIYYNNFNKILKNYKFEKRTKQPPLDEINSLISFGNTLVYSTCLKVIRKTQLDPTISFLHEPGYRRYSLSLDIAEIFKPLFIDRIIFKLINKKIINDKCFIKDDNKCYLNEIGKKLFLKEYESKLNTTIYHKKLCRNISYEKLIYLECFKLLKFINENEDYEHLKIWW